MKYNMLRVGLKFGILIFIINLLPGCSHQIYPDGKYQQIPVKVDGDLGEWNKPLRFSSEGQIQYNVTNDNENLYIAIYTQNETVAFKMLRSGINIYIDPAAEQSKKIDLAFPLPNTTQPDTKKSSNAAGTKPDNKAYFQTLLVEATSFYATGFLNLEAGKYDVSDKGKIKVAIKSDDDRSLNYEAQIPLRDIFGDAANEKKFTTDISVGIVINAMGNVGGNHSNGGNNSGGGGMHHGGHGGGGGRGGGGNYQKNSGSGADEASEPGMQTVDRSTLFKQDVNWYKFKLAVK